MSGRDLPCPVDVERCEQLCDGIEVLGDIVCVCHLDECIVGLTLRLTDRHGQASLLLGEQVGPDLVVVVQAQQFATLGHQVVDTVT